MVSMEDRTNHEPRPFRVLGALLGASSESTLLRQAVRPPAELRRIEDRLHVLTMVREYAPDVIVFAAQDSNRLPTAPLIDQCARERCDTRIVLLCAAPPSRSQSIIAAARAGARVLVAPTVNEFTFVLTRMARPSALERALDCEALASVQPPMLRELLCAAAKTVAEDGRVDTLAKHLQVSTRTLNRNSRRASVASPRVLLSAARLLWACALMESARRDMWRVARKTGFGGQQALLVEMRRYLLPLSSERHASPLPGYREALEQVVSALGGHLVAC
jgi:AraC-like DNA-binding protein